MDDLSQTDAGTWDVFEGKSTHLARTFMFSELAAILNANGERPLPRSSYSHAIETQNCLSKRSRRSRIITKRHLVALYGLDKTSPEFRGLLYFWVRDSESRRLLALLCAYARDPMLRLSASFILRLPLGSTITRQSTEQFIAEQESLDFSSATRRSLAQNLNGTWTQSGHLTGRVTKTRTRVEAAPGVVAYALFLAHLLRFRGSLLLDSPFASLLETPRDRLIELAEAASRRGWINFKRIQDVIEVQFPPEIEVTDNNVRSPHP